MGKKNPKERREGGREILISMILQTSIFHFLRFRLENQAYTV